MESYYLNSNGIIKEEFLDSKAKSEAGKFYKLNPSQIRRFFSEVKSLEKRLKDNNESEDYFQKILPLIKMLKAKVSYAYGRQVVTKEFEEFINEKINMIKTKEDFKAFVLHFEAVVGYFYGLSKR